MAKNPTTAEAVASVKATGKRRGMRNIVIAIAVSAAGFEGTRLAVYDDGLGNATVCMGQTIGVKFGQPARTLEECSSTLLDRIQANQDALQRRVGPIHTPNGPITYLDLPMGMQESMNSFYDNVGPGGRGVKDGLFALKKTGVPSSLVTLVRQGKFREACDQFLQWPNPKWMPGILKRREKERELCLRDLPSAA